MSMSCAGLYLIEILHQTTTYAKVGVTSKGLYLIEILHQTTTLLPALLLLVCCILLKFYIKPQQVGYHYVILLVVSY